MASENYTIVNMTTGGAVSQYAAVKLSTGNVVETTAATENVFGIAQYDAASGAQVGVQIDGTTLAIAKGDGTAIAVGDNLMPGADGKVLKATATGGEIIIGRALDASSADGDYIRVLLAGSYQYVTPTP